MRRCRRVAGAELHVGQPQLGGAGAGALHRLLADLDTEHPAAGRGQVQRESAHAAVEVEDAHRCRLVGPRLRLPVERGGDLGVGLEEAARAEVEHDLVDAHRQCRPLGEHDLVGALQHRLVHRLPVGADDDDLRVRVEEGRQVLAQPGQRLGRAEHEPHQELAVRRLGDQQVLELAAAGRHVVRREVGAGHERRQRRQQPVHGRRVQAAGAQVDPVTFRVEDAQRRVVDGARHHHLRLVAEPALPARDRLQPGDAGMAGMSRSAWSAWSASAARQCATLRASWTSYGVRISVHEPQRPSSKYSHRTRAA